MADYTALLNNSEMGSNVLVHLSAADVETARLMIEEPAIEICESYSYSGGLGGLDALFDGHIVPKYIGKYAFLSVMTYSDYLGRLSGKDNEEEKKATEANQTPYSGVTRAIQTPYSGVPVDDTIPY